MTIGWIIAGVVIAAKYVWLAWIACYRPWPILPPAPNAGRPA